MLSDLIKNLIESSRDEKQTLRTTAIDTKSISMKETKPCWVTVNQRMKMIQCILTSVKLGQRKQVAGEMAQPLIAFAALAEDLNSLPSIHTGWLTTTCIHHIPQHTNTHTFYQKCVVF